MHPGERIIYNCHTHTFTIDHVPSISTFRPIAWGMRRQTLKRFVIPFLQSASRIKRFRRWARYAAYLTATAGKDQEEVFRQLQSRYPKGSRFVVLPMDLTYLWGATPREPAISVRDQHTDLLKLRDHYGDAVIPFYAVDPRQPETLTGLKQAIEVHKFCGIKLYPNLGYPPSHAGLKDVWAYANEMRLPIITHCSRGGVHGYDEIRGVGVDHNTAEDYSAPYQYVEILKSYPNLRLCLAHLGGQEEWEKFLRDPWPVDHKEWDCQSKPLSPPSWLSQILAMLHEYPNLYTDISYTVFYFQQFVPALKVFLTNDVVQKRVLFGSDYYMADLEDDSERLLAINLRAALGEHLFWQIANNNPITFLGPLPR